MAKTNSSGEDFSILTDGFSLGGGTTPRKITVTGADINITGSGTAVITFPSTSSTLQTLNLNETVTGVKTFNDGKLGLRNVADTITSFFTNVNTVTRTYTLQNASGTLAFLSDITGGGTTTNSLTLSNTGSGDVSGTTFNGSVATTISYNSIGANKIITSGTAAPSGGSDGDIYLQYV
jgi:hypothetical protein